MNTDIIALEKIPSSKQIEQSTSLKLIYPLKRKWKGMRELNFSIKKKTNMEEKMKKISEQVNDLTCFKIKLIIDTSFKRDDTALTFFECFAKLRDNNIYYLDWTVSGNYSDKTSKGIGNTLSLFNHLYSLRLIIYEGGFGNQGVYSLIKCFQSLKNIHVLIFQSWRYYQEFIKEESREDLIKAIQGMNSLVQLDQNINVQWQYQNLSEEGDTEIKQVNDDLINLSTFYYPNLSLIHKVHDSPEEMFLLRKQMMKQFILNLNKNKFMITSICFRNDYYSHSFLPFFYQQQLSLCFELPYLTSFEDKMNEIEESCEIQKYQQIHSLLKRFTQEKYLKILEIVIFNWNIRAFLPFNNLWSLNDFYFN